MPKGNYRIDYGGNGSREQKRKSANKKKSKHIKNDVQRYEPLPKTRDNRFPTPKASRFFAKQESEREEALLKDFRYLRNKILGLNGQCQWLQRQKKSKGCATLCIGGGMGIALCVERI